jgi:hypothetical protein
VEERLISAKQVVRGGYLALGATTTNHLASRSLAAVDLFTASTAPWVLESIRLDLG